MEAASFNLAAGLTAAFSAEGPAFLDLALSGAADAFPEEAVAFWGASSAFWDGVDAFTGVGVALGAGRAKAGTTGSGAWLKEGTCSGLEAPLAVVGAASEVEGTNLDDVGAAFGWGGTERTIDEGDWGAGWTCAFWLAELAAGLPGANCLGTFLKVNLAWDGV